VPGKLDGKVALVTGGGSGIGRATVLALAREGARVGVVDVTASNGEETVRLVQAANGQATFIKADVSKSAEVEAMVNQVVSTYGRLDIGINNAGIEGEMVPTTDYPEDVWNRVIGINLTGVWLCMKYEIPHMLQQGGGSIVNTASILGLVGTVNTAAYTASKHGVVGLTKVAALEYSARGIRVNAVSPGYIKTPMVLERGVKAAMRPEVLRHLESLHPIGRLGNPEEVAQAILWLCTDAASFVTGVALPVDGGYTAQ